MLTSNSAKSLEKLLDFCATKQQVISKNIANIGTENYRREDINFKEYLAKNISPLKTSNESHITNNPFVEMNEEIEIIESKSEEMISGMNNVDIDLEMSELAENSIKYKFAARRLSSYFKNLQNIISGR